MPRYSKPRTIKRRSDISSSISKTVCLDSCDISILPGPTQIAGLAGHTCPPDRMPQGSPLYVSIEKADRATAVVAPRFIEGAIDRARGRPYMSEVASFVERTMHFSIIIPVLNEETVLEATLARLTRQAGGQHYELIIVDGGS